MITKKEKAKERFDELGICATEQGYSIFIGNKIYLDLLIVLLFKEIIYEELKYYYFQ